MKESFGEYVDFADCVRQNQDKDSPEAYCAVAHYKATGKYPSESERSIQEAIESGDSIHQILSETTRFSKLKRFPGRYLGHPATLSEYRPGDIILISDSSNDDDYNYERFTVIQNHQNKRYIIVYDKDKNKLHTLSNPTFKSLIVGHEHSSVASDKTVEKVLSTMGDQLGRIRSNPDSYNYTG